MKNKKYAFGLIHDDGLYHLMHDVEQYFMDSDSKEEIAKTIIKHRDSLKGLGLTKVRVVTYSYIDVDVDDIESIIPKPHFKD